VGALSAVALLLVSLATIAAADASWTTTRLTDSDTAKSYVRISGTRVTWMQWDYNAEGGLSYIMTKAGESAVTTVAAQTGSCYPAVSGSHIAWAAKDDSGVWHIYESSEPLAIGEAYHAMTDVRIRGTRLAWLQTMYSSDSSAVYTHELGDSSPVRVSTTDMQSCVNLRLSSTGRLVWITKKDGRYHVFTWKPGYDSPIQVTSGDHDHLSANVSGDRIVWREKVDGIRQVFTWKPGYDSPIQVTSGSVNHWLPAVSGDRIIWKQAEEGVYQIFSHVMGVAGTTQLTNGTLHVRGPVISGNHLAWRQMLTRYDHTLQVWAKDIGDTSASRLSTGDGYCWGPRISGNRIVWIQRVGTEDRREVYSATPAQ